MTNLLLKLKHEFLLVLPPTIFFFFAFNIAAITTALMLRGFGIQGTSILVATVLALVVGKVTLIADHLPFINKFPDKPLIYNIVWKTFVYMLAVMFARYLEHIIPLLTKGNNIVEAHQHLLVQFAWPRFVAIQIWFMVLFLFYAVLGELIRALGKERVI